MTEYVKIKCDDCKFEAECADYGWEGCRKFTPKPKQPQTNEEYLRNCSTEELANFLIKLIKICKACASGIGMDEVDDGCPCGECGCSYKEEVLKWLKEKYKEDTK